jgi:tricorn protease-like protein
MKHERMPWKTIFCVVLLLWITGIKQIQAQAGHWRIAYVLWQDTITSYHSIRLMKLNGRGDQTLINSGKNWLLMARGNQIWYQQGMDTAGKKRGLYSYKINSKSDNYLFDAKGLYQDIDYSDSLDLYTGGFNHQASGTLNKQYDIFLFSQDGKLKKAVTNDTAIDLEPVFYCRGERIIFRSNRDRNPASWAEFEIYSINIDGTGLQRLTFNPDTTRNVQLASNPGISPDGKIVFTGYWDKNYRIMMMNPDGSNIQPLIRMDNIEQTSYSFSPDGRFIVFAGKEKGARNSDIYLVQSDGKNLRQLTNGWQRKVQPVFVSLKKD